jgi:hypothetical protein
MKVIVVVYVETAAVNPKIKIILGVGSGILNVEHIVREFQN